MIIVETWIKINSGEEKFNKLVKDNNLENYYHILYNPSETNGQGVAIFCKKSELSMYR